MSPAEERVLIDRLSDEAREADSCFLVALLQRTVRTVEFASILGGAVDLDDAARIEFTILRQELEDRNLIRFH